MIVAGEASGDMHGAALAEALRKLDSTVRIFGMGGGAMEAAGVRILARLAPVVGLVEIFGALPRILGSLRSVKKALRDVRPDALVLIDNPDFNLRVAPEAKRLGIPVLYYVSPQVWAWRKSRIRKIAALVQTMAVILPFEEGIYKQVGLRVEYVGHPLVERMKGNGGDPEGLRLQLGLDRNRPVVAVLPGSRNGEVANHADLLEATLARLQSMRPEIQFVIPVAPTLDKAGRTRLEAMAGGQVQLVEGRSWDLFRIARGALVASGTASLEAALFRVPTVVFYRLNRFTYLMGRLLIRVDSISLANLLLDRRVIPEFIQGDATPENLIPELLELLDKGPRREKTLAHFDKLGKLLGNRNASEHTARLTADVAGWT